MHEICYNTYSYTARLGITCLKYNFRYVSLDVSTDLSGSFWTKRFVRREARLGKKLSDA